MPTPQEVERAWETGEEIVMTVYDECIICNKKHLGCELFVKIPEGISMCVKCKEKYPDNNKQGGKYGEWHKYIIGEGFIDLPMVDE